MKIIYFDDIHFPLKIKKMKKQLKVLKRVLKKRHVQNLFIMGDLIQK